MNTNQEDVKIEWQDETIEFTVEFSYSPGCKGTRDSFMGKAGMGPQLEPDEPAEVEIITVWGKDGNVECKNLKEEILDLIEAALWEYQEEHMADAAADRAESRYEAMMDAAEARADYY